MKYERKTNKLDHYFPCNILTAVFRDILEKMQMSDQDTRDAPGQKNNIYESGPGVPKEKADHSPWLEERFRAFFNSIRDAVFVHPYRHEGFAPFIEINDTACERYGYTRDEFLRLTPGDITISPDVEQHGKLDQRKKLLEARRLVFETMHIKKTGEKFPVEINSNIIEQDGKIIILAVARDITDRKKAEEALRKSEHQYRSLFNGSHAVMLIIDPDTLRIVDANPAAISFYGYDINEIRKLKISDINMLSVEEVFDILRNIKKDRQSHLYLRHCLSNGDIRDVEVYTGPVILEGKVFIHSIVHDITELKQVEENNRRLEERLKHSEKMEAIGTLAGGVAHEFNNLLGIIMGNTELAMGELNDTNPASIYFKEIYTASLRARDVVTNILNFARKSLTERVPVKISEIIRESLRLIRSTTPAMIEIGQNIGCENEMIMGDATELSQIVINLCNNAIQAITGETGMLEVRLDTVVLDYKTAAEYEDLKPGRYVRMTVKDSGCGIDPGIIGRIFDPYFTTGSLAERTGMGLSITHGIVKKHEGAIKVESSTGKGTTIEVLFPVTTEKEAKHVSAGKIEFTSDGRKRILFIDDEDALITIWKKILQDRGFEVVSVNNSLKALDLFKSDPDRFDIVLSDLGMPYMSGDVLAEELIKIRRNIPIIICTGYSDRINEEKAKAIGVARYIAKPIIIDELIGSIKEVMGKNYKQ